MSPPLYLWLLPPAPVQDRFTALIERLAQRLGTQHFLPHMTLVGSLHSPHDEIIRQTETLAATLAPIPVRLRGIGWTDQFYRCLFMRADRDVELLRAHETASAGLGKTPETDYMPHLSLVYGEVPQEQKEKIAREIGAGFDMAFHVDRVGLCIPQGTPAKWQLPYTYRLTGQSDRPH